MKGTIARGAGGSGRREFIRGAAAALSFAGMGGCASGRGGGRLPRATRGVVVSAKNLSGAFDWPRLAREAGLTTVATHIGPEDVLPFMKSDLGRRFTEACAANGIAVEHELNAMDWLLPRDRFDREPALFRMNAKGERERKSNCCVSNPHAIEIVAERAVEVAKVCRSTTGRYYYWFTDNGDLCRCPKCRDLSGADQATIVENAIVRALRREIDPEATLSHLAYLTTLATPKAVAPDPALFLEFAPIRRWHRTTKREPLTEDGEYLSRLDDLLTVFPAATAQVLEYWLDESLFCGWKKPLVRIPWDAERTCAEVAAYAKRGIRHFTTFAVSVDDDYVKDFGVDSLSCVKEYGRILKEVLR